MSGLSYPFLNRLADFEGKLAGLRQQFVGAQYNAAYLEESVLTFLEKVDEDCFWMYRRELAQHPRYHRVEFLLAFDTEGFFRDIEANVYPRSGKPYRELIEVDGEWAEPIVEVLSSGIIQPAPADAETEWSILAGDYPVDEEFLDAPPAARQTIALWARYSDSLTRDYRWAMRCLTGVTRHAAYAPGPPDPLFFLAYTGANRGRHAEAARLLQTALKSEAITLEHTNAVLDVMKALDLEGDALRYLLSTLMYPTITDALLDSDSVADNEEASEIMEEFWHAVSGLLPALVRGRRWTELGEVLGPLELWAEQAPEEHQNLLKLAKALTQYYSGSPEQALQTFDQLASGRLPAVWAQAASGIIRWKDEGAAEKWMAALTATFPRLPEDSEDAPVSRTFVGTAPTHYRWRSLFPSPILNPLDAVGALWERGVDWEPVTLPVSSLSDGREHVVRARECPEEGPLRSVLVQVDPDESGFAKSVRESYPVAYCGIPNRAMVTHLYHCAHQLAGVVRLEGIGDFDLEAFLPYFHEYQDKLEPETPYDFELYGFVEEFAPRSDWAFEINDGPGVDVLRQLSHAEKLDADSESEASLPIVFNADSTAMFRDTVRNAVYSLCSRVEALEWITFQGKRVCRMIVPLAGDFPSTVRIALLAGEHVLGDFEPRVGEAFGSLVWLHGRLVSLDGQADEVCEQRADDSHNGTRLAPVGFLPHSEVDEPLHNKACQCVARTLELCGEIAQIEPLYGGLTIEPDLTFLTHGGRRHFVNVRVLQGGLKDGQHTSWGAETGKQAYAASSGMTPCHFVEVALKEVPDGYEAAYRGFEAIADMLMPR